MKPTLAHLIIIALTVGCGTQVTVTTPSPATSTPTDRATVEPTPTPGPIQPEAISLRLARLQGIGPFLPTMTVYETGRLLTLNERFELVERRLTPAGVDLIRHAMLETGLFERSMDYPIQIREGVQPPGREVPFDRFRLATPSGQVVVGSMPLEDPTWIVPSPERDALARLAERMVDLSWLPDAAWVNRNPTPYQAPAFLLFGGDLPIAAAVDPAAPDMANVAWPFAVTPERLGGLFVSADGNSEHHGPLHGDRFERPGGPEPRPGGWWCPEPRAGLALVGWGVHPMASAEHRDPARGATAAA